MSILEKQELFDRTKGMTEEEQRIAVTAIPMSILIDELHRRNDEAERMLSDIRGIMEGGAV